MEKKIVAAKKAKSAVVSILSKEDAAKLGESIARRGKVLENDVQKLLITAVGYNVIHGNIDVAQRMYTQLSSVKGFRMQAVVAFMEKFANIKFDDKGTDDKVATKNFVFFKNEKALPKDAVKIVTTLMLPENHWTVVTKESVKSTVDALEKVRALLDSLAGKAKKGEEVANKELINVLQLAVASYTSQLAIEKGEVAPLPTENSAKVEELADSVKQ